MCKPLKALEIVFVQQSRKWTDPFYCLKLLLYGILQDKLVVSQGHVCGWSVFAPNSHIWYFAGLEHLFSVCSFSSINPCSGLAGRGPHS